jgi:glycosyltransferase involved in cell wall biosynthesis
MTGRRRLSVAVVIPTIPGRSASLGRANASIVAQRRQPDQVIVEWDLERTGAAATRNRALAKVRTDFIAWLDDDDWLKPNHIITGMRELEADPAIDLLYPIPEMVGGPDPTATTYQGRFPVSPWGLRWDQELEAHLRKQGSFVPMTHFVRTDLVRQVGGFHDGYETESPIMGKRFCGEDEDYLVRLLDAGARFTHMPRKTWYWNASPHRKATAGRGTP